MKLHSMVKGSLATDCIQRENECVEQCKAQSRSKWRGGKSILRQKPLPSQCTSSQNSGGTWVLEQWPGGALYSPPPVCNHSRSWGMHTQNAQHGQGTWLGCTRVSVLFVHLPQKHVKDKSWAKEMNKDNTTKVTPKLLQTLIQSPGQSREVL